MIRFPPADSLPATVLADLQEIGRRLQLASPADTVACAYGIGDDVWMWYDESAGSYFDLASLTKPLFTAPAALGLLADSGAIDEPVATSLSWLPRLHASPTVRQLLTHAAGLPSELLVDRDRPEMRNWMAAQVQSGAVPREFVVYSDVSYWVLGEWITAIAAEPLNSQFANVPTAGSGSFLFGLAPADRSVPAGPTTDNMRLPHDPAARRLGLSGHAGAFGTLTGVVHAVVSWLDCTWLTDPVATQAITCQTHAIPGGHRSLAWTLAGDPFHAVAHDWPPTTLCHTGFTGVSIALDPVSRWWAVYLSNALPVAGDAGPILKARRLYHAYVAAHLRRDQRSGSNDPTKEG